MTKPESRTERTPVSDFEGQHCVLTGGAGSIGLAAARQLLARGASVHLVDRDPALLEAARQALAAEGHGERVGTSAADVSDSRQTQDYLAQAVARAGAIDFLFCNAGLNGEIVPITAYPEDVFDTVMAVNVRGTFLALKHGLPLLRDGGSVLITSSVMGVTADPGVSAYATSKHALIGLMRVAAKEVAPRGIRVNAIAPGPTTNGFQNDIERRLSDVVGRDATQMLNEAIPLHRHAQPEEIARMVVFLASAGSSFSTGGVFMADGGMHI
jgi:NAD(P)-dependent dehydrogenase (short-subunit alcohol dehydrogenase family)